MSIRRPFSGVFPETNGSIRLAVQRHLAAHDRRLLTAHDAEICDGAPGFGMRQRQGKPGPVRQFPATVGDTHPLLLGARGQREQHQCYCGEYGSHPEVFSQRSQIA